MRPCRILPSSRRLDLGLNPSEMSRFVYNSQTQAEREKVRKKEQLLFLQEFMVFVQVNVKTLWELASPAGVRCSGW